MSATHATSLSPPSSSAHAQEPSQVASLADVLDALRAAGEETRLRILLLLTQSELTVSDLARVLGQSQPRVSRHIKVLLDAGLIERHREGSWIILRLGGTASTVAAIQGALELLSEDLPERRHDLSQLQLIKQERHERAQTYFAREARNWNTLRSLHVEEARVETALLDLVGAGPYSKLIDLGTGTGRLLELLASRCRRAIGFDVNADMLAYARVQLDRPELRHCQVRRGDILRLSEFHATAELVTLHQVLHVLGDPAAAVSQAGQLLVPGGRLLIVDFAPHDLEHLRAEQSHVRLGLSQQQMKRWLDAAGLKLLEQVDLPPNKTGNLTVSLWLAERPVATPIRPTKEPLS